MQRHGVQLHSVKLHNRDELWMDQGSSCRDNAAAAGSGTGNPNETLTNTTASPVTVRYVYTLTANGCTNPATYNVDVLVNPTPTLTSTLTPPAICSGTVFSYTPSSSTTGTSFGWTRAAVAGITPAAAGSGTGNPNETLTNTTASPVTVRYVYTLTANGCTNPATYNVDVLSTRHRL